jgi:hypothetical protein
VENGARPVLPVHDDGRQGAVTVLHVTEHTPAGGHAVAGEQSVKRKWEEK